MTPTTLRERRESLKMSLRGVAALIRCSHVFLGEVERGDRPLPARFVDALAVLYGCSRHELIESAPPNSVSLAGLPPAARARVVALVAELRAA